MIQVIVVDGRNGQGSVDLNRSRRLRGVPNVVDSPFRPTRGVAAVRVVVIAK
jgi:hypothetical protein